MAKRKKNKTIRSHQAIIVALIVLIVSISIPLIVAHFNKPIVVKTKPIPQTTWSPSVPFTKFELYDWRIIDSAGNEVAYKKHGQKPCVIDSMAAIKVLKKVRSDSYSKFNI